MIRSLRAALQRVVAVGRSRTRCLRCETIRRRMRPRSPPDRASSPRRRSIRGPDLTGFARRPRSRPFESTSRTETPGNGRPTVPARRSPVVGIGDQHQRLAHAVALEDRVAEPVAKCLEDCAGSGADPLTRTGACHAPIRAGRVGGPARAAGRTSSARRRTASAGTRRTARRRSRARSARRAACGSPRPAKHTPFARPCT